MTLDTLANLLTAFAAVGALIMSWQNSKKIEVVHKATNSMKDELVREVRKSEHASGMKDQLEKEKTVPIPLPLPVTDEGSLKVMERVATAVEESNLSKKL